MSGTAFVHDWLVGQRGGENVLQAMLALDDEAPIYTLIHEPGAVDASIEARTIHTSWLQATRGRFDFRRLLPLFPSAVRQWDLAGYRDVVVSSHCAAMGVKVAPEQRLLAYVHTPVRYFDDQATHYLKHFSRPVQWLVQNAGRAYLHWERHAAQRADKLVTNSHFVASRVWRRWKRKAQVVYPPVDVSYFSSGADERSSESPGLVVAGALVPYKRVDLAVAAATREGWPLTVVGDGPERVRLMRQAGSNVRFLGWVPRTELRNCFRSAEALLFPGCEDFGILPVEAMAAGCPVVAYAAGGALETVQPGRNGVLFQEQSIESMSQAVGQARDARQKGTYDKSVMLESIRRFRAERFVPELREAFDWANT